MGQDWTLFNLDKYEAASVTGVKLGEFFCDGRWESYMLNLLLSGQRDHDSWGGDRLVLLGDYAEDLPPNTVTDEDLDLLKMRAGMIPADADEEKLPIYYELKECSEKRRSVEKATHHLPMDTVYALRSLHKKEYVRRDIVMDYREYFADVTPGLAQALYTRVGWSDDPSAALVYTTDDYIPESGGTITPLHRGAWAGNRIDIVALTNEMQKTLDEEGWTDISEETARHVSDVYACDGF